MEVQIVYPLNASFVLQEQISFDSMHTDTSTACKETLNQKSTF